ncbi:HSR1-like GTP-binding protein [Nitzschia inconspicua]|uniref:HSR1-like GTP-binding protein n=1 Tax=Nitzschia inconspicua TaxID=303405 RepID=A0A9K3PJA4_9STRA|nr:HSR1-like GTP-binding protein [Nitzschia inconspicua]
MPRNQGTSRKGKPKKHERAAGMGRSLQKSRPKRHTPSASTGGMAMRQGVESINTSTKNEFIDNRASVLDVNDLDDFLIQAEMANREFISEKEQVVVLDATAQAASNVYVLDNDSVPTTLQGRGPVSSHFAFQELSVPRRPAWDETTTADELHRREKEAFLDWRRGIAQKEEEIIFKSSTGSISSLGVTPFEKNIEIWRQLWRVLERCSCIVQIVDARNPLFYLSKDLKAYTTQELGKPMLLLINKSDYLSPAQRQAWHDYFSDPDNEWEHVFFSAHEEQHRLDEEAAAAAREEELEEEKAYQAQVEASILDEHDVLDQDGEDGDGDNTATVHVDTSRFDQDGNKNKKDPNSLKLSYANVGVEKPLSRLELLGWLRRFAEDNNCTVDPKYDRVPFGMVGFPNVGKSSVINVLMGHAKNAHGVVRVGVASQPGKTKHFQTLLLPDREDMLLCDCPGLVFPSFVNNTADLIAAGVYPIAQMRDWRSVMDLLCRRIPREVLNAQYGIQIPMPTADAMLQAAKNGKGKLPAPTAEEFLSAFCEARNMFAAASGVPDYQRASRIIVKEYADGKLLYCHAPPKFDENSFQLETLRMALQKTKKLRDKLLPSTEGEYPGLKDASDERRAIQMDSLTPKNFDSVNSSVATHESVHWEVRSLPAGNADWLGTSSHPVFYCRKEASRLLGLIGAPPLQWKLLDSDEETPISKTKDGKDPSSADALCATTSLGIIDLALKSLIHFLEAHVKLLLVVDQAYYWLKVSASLHWGLGPNSQCVERVERAETAKEYRKSKNANGEDEMASSLEPRRRLDATSILALTTARRNVAQCLVDQSLSLVETFRRVQALSQANPANAHERENDSISSVIDDQVLLMPQVVDLSWMKTSRNHIASLLSYIIDSICTVAGLQILADQEKGRESLMQSMLNAENAQEHIRSNLLLGDLSPSERASLNESNDLIAVLLQYREQLEAMSAALWSCQQYSGDVAPSKDPNGSSHLAWWDKVKELSANCKVLEEVIESKLVTSLGDNQPLDLPEEAAASENKDFRNVENGNYEHASEGLATSHRHGVPSLPSKTVVFAGSGSAAKEGEGTRTPARVAKARSSDVAPIPERDTVAELLLVRELQNRISLMPPSEEEERPHGEPAIESCKTLANTDHHHTSTEHSKMGSLQREEGAPASESAKERAPVTNMFLGSSSLFAELKKTLPQVGETVDARATSSDEEEETFGDDDLMMEMMMGASAATGTDSTGKAQKPARKKKWGRKGRKVRNKDPYGMFLTPDDMLGKGATSEAPPVGVTVKGGKHGRKGYTRQTGYGSVRAILQE